jgi:hypothetical protein
MSSLLPLLKDLVPIMKGGSPVHVTKSTGLDSGTGQTEGMIRKGAIINKSDKICASGMSISFSPRFLASRVLALCVHPMLAYTILVLFHLNII